MNNLRFALHLALSTLCLALAACQDAVTTAPTEANTAKVASKPAVPIADTASIDVASRVDGLRDALVRVQPALAHDDRSAAVAAGLQQALAALERADETAANQALVALEKALQRYTASDEALSPDVDAIRVAVRSALAR